MTGHHTAVAVSDNSEIEIAVRGWLFVAVSLLSLSKDVSPTVPLWMLRFPQLTHRAQQSAARHSKNVAKTLRSRRSEKSNRKN